MDTLRMEPTYRVVLGDVARFQIMVVGAGGTGSTLALFLAGLAYHARQKRVLPIFVRNCAIEMEQSTP